MYLLQQEKSKGIVTSYADLPTHLKDNDLTEELFSRYQKKPVKGAGYAKYVSDSNDAIVPLRHNETSPFHKKSFTNFELGSPYNYKFNGYSVLNDKINNYLTPNINEQSNDSIIALTEESEVFSYPRTIIPLPEHRSPNEGTKQQKAKPTLQQKREEMNSIYSQQIQPRGDYVRVDNNNSNNIKHPKLDHYSNQSAKISELRPKKQKKFNLDAIAKSLQKPLLKQTTESPWEYKLYEDVELIDPNKFSPYIKDKSCYLNSTEIVANHGYGGNKNKSSRKHVFKLLEEVDGELYYYGDDIADNYQNAINCINRHLDNGRVIIVGVNHSPNQLINENATDHFIVISGRGFDPILRKHYHTYYEVGSAKPTGYNPVQNRLIYDPENLEFYDPISFRRDKARYDVTQVRPNDGDTIGTASQDVTNPTKIKNK